MLLPLSEAAVKVTPPQGMREPDNSQRARILVVEDEDQIRAVVSRTLEGRGYVVLQARDGQEALDQLERVQGAVDAVLSDVVMPVMSGVDLAERLATAWPQLPIIWMSGYTRDSAFSDGVMREHQPFLQKPVSDDLLTQTIEGVLAARSSR